MSIAIVENEIKKNFELGKKFVTKFVDIGQGSGKLNNGVLQAEKSDKYIQHLTDRAVFLEKTKVITSTNHKRQVDKMSFNIELDAGRINGVPQVLSESQEPEFSDRSFNAEELRALTGLHRTVLKDSIERQGFMNTLTSKFAEANGLALERVLIYGNTDSTENVRSGYKVIDGIIKKIEDDADISDETIDLTATESNPIQEFYHFLDMFPDVYKNDGGLAMFAPSKYVRSVYRFIASNHNKYDINAYISTTGEPVLEDVHLFSVPQFSTPMNGYTEKPIILTHKENIQWLADPENIIVESAFNLRANVWDIASTMYADIQFVEEDAVALAWLKEE